MPPVRAWSMQRWFVGLVAIVLLPVVVLFVWTVFVRMSRAQKHADRAALHLARTTAAQIRELHAGSAAMIARMTAQPGIAAHDPTSCAAVFAAALLPRYADLLLFDEQGALVCSGNSDPAAARVSLAARRWLERELRAGRRPAVPVTLTIDEQPTLMLASATGPMGGMLVLVERMTILPADAVPGAVVMILDRDGDIVTRSAPAEKWSRNIAEARVVRSSPTGLEGIAHGEGIFGRSRQYGFAHVPDLGWSVYAKLPVSMTMGLGREMLVNTAIGATGILLIAGMMSIALTRTIGRPIRALVTAAGSADEGLYTRVRTEGGPLEVAALVRVFNCMIDRRQAADERMHDGERKLKALSERLLTVQEEERRRIARELHDGLGQSLTALKMDVIGLLQATAPPPALAPMSDRILRTLDATVAAVQQISFELRPGVLDDLGLVTAIEAEARLFEERTGIEWELFVDGDTPLDDDCVTAVYRIVQEALTNVARHSNATRTELRLHYRADELLLEIRDDGRGATEEELSDPLSLGMIGIRERAAHVGGTVQFEGSAGQGTRVRVRIPLARTGRPA